MQTRKKALRIKALLSISCIGLAGLMPIPAMASSLTQEGLGDASLDATADGSVPENGDIVQEFSLSMGTDMDSAFASLKDSLRTGQGFNLSDTINAYSQNPVSTSGYMDLASVGLSTSADIGAINIAYDQLSNAMNAGFQSYDLSGSTANCISLLDETYGGVVSGLSMTNPRLPDEYSVENIMKSAKSAVTSSYKQALGDSGIQKVKNSIDTSSIFAEAKAGESMSMPSLKSYSSLSGMVTDASAAKKLASQLQYGADSAAIATSTASQKTNINSKVQQAEEEAQERYNENVDKAWDNHPLRDRISNWVQEKKEQRQQKKEAKQQEKARQQSKKAYDAAKKKASEKK